MAVQSQQYPAAGVTLAENPALGRMRYELNHRGLLVAVDPNENSSNAFLGKNAFQIPSAVNMPGPNQYHLFNQLSGGRHGYANQQQQQQLDEATQLLIGVNEKDQLTATPVTLGSRKRGREVVIEDHFCSPWPNPPPPQQYVINGLTQLDTHPGSVVNPQSTNGVSTGLRLAFEDDHRLRSASPVSTSGCVEPAPKPTWSENFASHLQQEREEVTQLLKIQNEQLKSFIEEKRQRHARQLIAAAEEGFQRKMREKDSEMEKVRRQNQELMDRFTQLNAESQHWQTKVRNTEAMVNLLRSNLAQAQQQNANASQFPQLQTPKEGCGDSEAADDCASSYVDDINDAHTRACNENRELREQRTCRVCRCNDVSMLLLPCRHLCLCQDCEGQLHACPLCRTPKNASVQVYMS
ncbi:hypothetical protein M758_8G166000 [Ceratodon purpureus]|nr:hypothetical protein M758_8G166000 [Ceratodon purpureus]